MIFGSSTVPSLRVSVYSYCWPGSLLSATVNVLLPLLSAMPVNSVLLPALKPLLANVLPRLSDSVQDRSTAASVALRRVMTPSEATYLGPEALS